jgi:hypothetical protein
MCAAWMASVRARPCPSEPNSGGWGVSGEEGLGLDFTLYMLYKFIFGIITLPKDAIRRIGGHDVSKMDEYDTGDSIGFFCDGSHNQLRKDQL